MPYPRLTWRSLFMPYPSLEKCMCITWGFAIYFSNLVKVSLSGICAKIAKKDFFFFFFFIQFFFFF